MDIAGIDVSRETMDRLEGFSELTAKWTKSINLVAKSTVSDIWARHIVDSAQLYKYAPEGYTHWVDIGTGGGFPGIVMAIIAKEKQVNAQFTMIESDARKCTFLRTASRELDLNVYVQTQRIEETTSQNADVVSARALGSLKDILPLAQQHLNTNGTALFMKGRRHADELAEVSADWDFELVQYPSITDAEAAILSFKRITRAG